MHVIIKTLSNEYSADLDNISIKCIHICGTEPKHKQLGWHTILNDHEDFVCHISGMSINNQTYHNLNGYICMLNNVCEIILEDNINIE